jgi:thiamine pyrophosphate-dependent acetolactate synthase large subunit-like protein
MIGGGKGCMVQTEEELEIAVNNALDSKELFVINTILDRKDISLALRRMTEALSKKL